MLPIIRFSLSLCHIHYIFIISLLQLLGTIYDTYTVWLSYYVQKAFLGQVLDNDKIN